MGLFVCLFVCFCFFVLVVVLLLLLLLLFFLGGLGLFVIFLV